MYIYDCPACDKNDAFTDDPVNGGPGTDWDIAIPCRCSRCGTTWHEHFMWLGRGGGYGKQPEASHGSR